jgi:hypothetical protein
VTGRFDKNFGREKHDTNFIIPLSFQAIPHPREIIRRSAEALP